MRLPLIVAGRRVEETSGPDVELRGRTGSRMAIPALDGPTVDAILAAPRDGLADVPLHDIVAFLNNVGHNWRSKEYSRRRLYVRYLCRQFGYSEKMAETEANWISLFLSSHYRLFDMLSVELGSWHMVDGWYPREEAFVRALPRGRALHLAPGNVPLSSVASLVRALITKNVSVFKVSSDDPMTPLALAMSFLDTDASHPVTKSLSVVHWRGGQEGPEALRLLHDSDVVCAWGGTDVITWAMRNAPPETEVLKFGPRRSVAVIGRDADRTKAARALAHDVAMYDQRACFSVQHVYVEQPIVESFVNDAEAAFRHYEGLLPKGVHDFDERAGWSLAHLQALFRGDDVRVDDDRTWSVVVAAQHPYEEHPLGRTLFVHPVASVAEVAQHLGPDVQTVAVYPGEVGYALRDACARKGVARVVELGLNNVFRVGGTHDGMYPLQRLVRFASMEMPASIPVKGIVVPIDQTTFLEQDRFVEFIP
ncbi:MAG: aldehyde dehydrogenase family protein [Polyangiaceae bacterium]|jgi:long-chain-fatty-acyl-CoA reductase|nr:aldehyde dehydrogenase family protein [Polyangiaceae bacterium]